MKIILNVFLIFFLFFTANALAEDSAKCDVSVSKQYGYFIGDLVYVKYHITVPLGMELDLDSLPAEGTEIEKWLELVKIKILEKKDHEIKLLFVYQVFILGSVTQKAKIPPVEFRYGSESLESPPVSLQISPLTHKKSKFRPPIFWEHADSLTFYSKILGGVLVAMGLFFLALFARKSFLRVSPFKEALKKIKSTKTQSVIFALTTFRDSLNQKAGCAIFANNLESLFEKMPRASKHEKILLELINLSDKLSFCSDDKFQPDTMWRRMTISTLKNLLRRERWI